MNYRKAKITEKSLATSTLANAQAKEIFAGFYSKQITVVPLKGLWFGHVLYDDFTMRGMTDIDLLVYDFDFEYASTVLISLGYKTLQNLKAHFGFGVQIERVFLKKDFLPVELHLAVASGVGARKLSKLILSDGVTNNCFSCANVIVPTNEQALVAMALHFRDHGLAAGLNQVTDMYGMLNRLKPDMSQVIKLAKKCSCLIPLYLLLQISGFKSQSEMVLAAICSHKKIKLIEFLSYKGQTSRHPRGILGKSKLGNKTWRLLLHTYLTRDSLKESMHSQLEHLLFEIKAVHRYLGKK